MVDATKHALAIASLFWKKVRVSAIPLLMDHLDVIFDSGVLTTDNQMGAMGSGSLYSRFALSVSCKECFFLPSRKQALGTCMEEQGI